MASENQILQGLDQEAPEYDPTTDAATDAAERSEGITPDDAGTKELEDGGAIITLQDDEDVKKSEEFYSNLAEDMPEDLLSKIAVDLLDLIDDDIEERKERDKQYADGLRRTGFGKDAPGGATFDGASKVVHPLMSEVAIDFSARAIKELWPAGGPAKDEVVGEPDDKKEEKAKRKIRYMNFQLTKKMPNTRYELEQILTQVVMGGVQYSKLWQDVKRKTPVHEPVWVDEIILPGSATSFYGSPRKAHRESLDDYTFKDRIRNGVYRDVDYISATATPDDTRAKKATDKIEGVKPGIQNQDGVRTVYEVSVQYLLPDEKRKITDTEDTGAGPAPYLISIDDTTRKVLSVYRNWDEDDENLEELVHIIEWPFLPWRGAMPIGAPQILSGLAAATTGALRSLLDSAHINNFPGGMRLKSGPMGGQNIRVDGEQTNEVEGGLMIDDVRKAYMPIPLNPTSSTLFELLQFLVDSGKSVVKTTLDEANDNANVPVGTIMARIEQQLVVFSAIHSRLHNAMGHFLRVLHRLNATYLDDKQVVDETGEQMCFKADFDAPDDVVPVSDPEIFSELQRIGQVQTIAQRAQLFPQIYDQRKVEERILSMMKVKNPKEFLVPVKEPKPMDAVNENIAATMGQPVIAFPAQDHLAHIQVHLSFLEDPMFGANPLMAGQGTGFLLQNIKEHMLYWYGTEIHRIASEAAGQDITNFMTIKDAEVQTAFDGMLAAAVNRVQPSTRQVFANVPPIIQRAQQMLQQMSPPPPMDPSQAALQGKQMDNKLGQAKLQQQAQADAQMAELKKAELAQSAQSDASDRQLQAQTDVSGQQNDLTIAQADNQARQSVVQSQNATKLEVTAQDNRVAEEIAGAEIAAGHKTNITNGQAVGKEK